MKKIGIVCLFYISGIIAIVGCKKQSEINKNYVVVAIQSSPLTLDPRYATDAAGMRITNLIFNSLVRVGPNLEIIGDAAQSWSYKNKVYTFRLHPGLRFSNGDPVTPEDIEYTFQQFRAENSPFRTTLASINEVKAQMITQGNLEQIQVKIQLDKFLATLLGDLPVIKILPKKIVEKHGDNFSKNLIGSGSFKVKKISSSEIELSAVKNHAWAAPKIDGALFKVIKDDNTLFLKTLKGDIDISQAEISLDKVKDLEKESHLSVYRYAGASMNYMIFNLKDSLLADLNLRTAIAHSIDRKEIIDFKFAGLATPATSILSTASPYHNKSLDIPVFNLKKAKNLLPNKDLKNLSLTLKVANSPDTIEVAQVLAKQIRELGIDVKIQSFEWGTFYRDIKSGRFQIALMRWVGAIDPDIYRLAFHSTNFPPGRNRGFYKNSKVDQMLDEGISIENQQKRIQHYHSIERLIISDLPTIPLWYPTQVAVVHKRIQKYQPVTNSDFSALKDVEIKQEQP